MPSGERSLSSEGEIVADVSPPSFGADDSVLYYLLRHGSDGSGPELWRMMVESGKSEAVFPGVSMLAYDVSPDGKQVVYCAAHDAAEPGNCGSPLSTEALLPGESAIPAKRGRTLDRVGRSCFKRQRETSTTWSR